MVDNLKKLNLIKEPGQVIKVFGSRVIEMARRISSSRSAPPNLTAIAAGCFIECDVLPFKLKALGFFDKVDDEPNAMSWDEIVRKLKSKYRSLLDMGLWEPQKSQVKIEESSMLDRLHAAINKLTAQVAGEGGRDGLVAFEHTSGAGIATRRDMFDPTVRTDLKEEMEVTTLLLLTESQLRSS